MDDFEDRLRRFRPVGPPDALRDRVLLATGDIRRSTLREWWPSLTAAAAAIVLYALGADLRAQLIQPGDSERSRVVTELSEQLGADPLVLEVIELSFDMDERRVADFGERDRPDE